jgi:hypothetical protein
MKRQMSRKMRLKRIEGEEQQSEDRNEEINKERVYIVRTYLEEVVER